MKNKKELKSWLNNMGLSHPLIIAGPCSAETEEQVLTIAHQLKDTDTTVLRAGVWKPRTRPGNFEGVGEVGLKWLQRAKEETGLLIAIEVANASHVKLALKHDIDILWIGARSTVSPFIMQEIADALQGTDKVVLVKNPINPDLPLWLGGVERLYQAKIKNLGVIHRGFSTLEKSKYRNTPEWTLPIELQKRFPDLPIICDPSHIAGNRDYIFDICQQALELNYDGLMVETHHDPDSAWSDAEQQVTPQGLVAIISDLKVKKNENMTDVFQQNLINLRMQIDLLDNQLLNTLGKRMQVAQDIGVLKKTNNSSLRKNQRWNEVIDKIVLKADEVGLSEDFILNVFNGIHQESLKNQERI
ncbi:chorismate mutase [Vibrio lentus]|uniref:chorismate mutase n=2 Tax=Vibrio lentus TaxID=136468 RepID=A0AB36XKC3_9VIBR|nr:bifunctional 3-deoxy-7-phosphoheptulonate synthase/chorismate mutase type II [Vibrio lentus]MCC4836910.1 bifunctional 3-deoxy-7-phosphoheptulonate synthase/chorismate mutase type II [Vibrio lentus]PMI14270.1 3-deoxy-7-phosphoheptulonate synthase [Vibrio lentus]PMK29828.1 3-deoxy-7-phosphoheptulonate synthase [Vibrio lentus]PMK45916.1 3-deoxy-7-phosphoheptulonate synthase [Vibrio lentus]PML29232.1 3-deoxy-7-phosphoheptulonate synthase [Vibrio lentus]